MRINSLKGGLWILTTLTTFNRPQSHRRNMKTFFLSALLSLSLSIAAVAQGINIGYPANGASLPVGSSFTVEVDKPVRSPPSYHSPSSLNSSSTIQNSLSGSVEVALVIGLNSCFNTTCPSPTSESDVIFGNILYNGPLNATYQTNPPDHKPPHQNFTLTVPANVGAGTAVLTVYHVSLIGVRFGFPFWW